MTKFLALFIKALVTVPVVAALFFVTLSNRDASLDLTWSPMHEATMISVPLIIFISCVLGFMWGSFILWSNTLELRAERRSLKKQISALEKQVDFQRMEIERQTALKQAQIQSPPSSAPMPRIAVPEIL